MENRNFIIDRLKAKTVTIDEFNYDALQAPPIASMFSPFDIAQLNQIAKSIKYSAKPQVKYQEIDKIMRRRGFVKFAAGTNRVVYRPVENNTFVIKVAYDAVGLGDNPKEFRNQFIFKPFVTKCFEVTPCGTLGVFERVNPITSREEFLSVASDVFEVINNWFIGEYVLEDIGVRYFMNYGIRTGFGPVILDYSYVYKLDGNKLYCNAPDKNHISGLCSGVIDYDPGYNFLYCTKCGVKYKAKELEEAIKEKEVIVKSEGDVKMKISIKGGSKEVNKSVNVGEYAGLAKSMPSKPINMKKKEKETRDVYPSIKVSVNKKVNKVQEVEVKEEKKVEIVTEPTPVPEVTVADQRSNREIICPIEFDESLMNPAEKFKNLIKDVVKLMEDASEDNYETMYNFLNDTLIDKFTVGLVDLDECEEEELEVTILSRAADYINMSIDDEYNDDFVKFVKSIDEKATKKILTTLLDEELCNISFNKNVSFSNGEDEDKGKYLIIEIVPEIKFNSGDRLEIEETYIGILPKDIIEPLADCDYNIYQRLKKYNDCKYFPAKIINIKDIFPAARSEKIIVIIDKDGNYLTMEDGNIIAIDMIDDKSLGSLSIVPAEWLNETLKKKEEYMNTSNSYEIEYEIEEEKPVESDKIPTGILPPVGVNGVVAKED